ncbi:hypothetical protein [Aliivibrio fischeri]|nr:hypothetical protein [Aliivibrio fischeri]MUI52923.1 hypothetical protein [Aliivibrio fischeri]
MLTGLILSCSFSEAVYAHTKFNFSKVCKVPELEGDIRNFEENIADLYKIDINDPNITPKEIEQSINQELPTFESGLAEFANKFAAVISLSVGGFDLLEGVETGNSDKTTEGIVTASTYLAPEIVGEVIGTLFSESIAEAVNPITGLIVIEALAINQDIKLASEVSKMIEADHKLMKIYQNAIKKTNKQLEKLRKIIVGDYAEIYNYDYERFGAITLQLHKNSFNTLVKRLFRDNFRNKIKYISDKKKLSSLINYNISSIDNMTINEVISSLQYVNNQIRSTYFTTNKFVNVHGGIHIKLNNVNWANKPGIYAVYKSIGFNNVLHDSFVWMKVFKSAVNTVADKIYDDNTQIMNDFKTILTDTRFINGIQHSMIKPYNDTVKQNVAWQEFGYQVLSILDYNDAETIAALANVINVLIPIIGSVIDIPLVEKISNEVNVAPLVFALTKSFVNRKIDITDKEAFTNILNEWKNKNGSSDKLYDKLLQAHKTVTDKYSKMTISESDITLKPINQNKLNTLLKRVDKNIKNGNLKKKINIAIKEEIDLKLPFGTNNVDTSNRLLDIAQVTSSIQNSYFRVIVNNINRTTLELSTTNDRMIAATRLSELRERLVAIKNNHYNMNYTSGELKKYSNANFGWLTFSTTPYLDIEHKTLLEYLDKITTTLID